MIDSSLLPLAAFPEEVIIPIVAIVFFLMIPIVAILTTHQRKMAELMRHDALPQGNPTNLPNMSNLSQPQNFANNDIYALRQDVQQLRDMVSSLAINLDNMNDRLNQQNAIQDRVKVGE